VDLAVFGDHRARHVATADTDIGARIGGADPPRDGADTIFPNEFQPLGDLDRHAGRREQPRACLGDQPQDAVDVSRLVRDGAQDLGGRGVSLSRRAQLRIGLLVSGVAGFQLLPQRRDFPPKLVLFV
jgi:hypothetical protein